MKLINIAFVTDDHYFNYMTVTIKSILKHLPSNVGVNFYIVDSGISMNSKKKLYNLFTDRKGINFQLVPINTNLISKYNIKTHVSIAAYAKVYFPEILDAQKVIYLDCDLILNTDISQLWDEFDNIKCVKAVWNPFYNYDNRYLGLSKEARTFNSGVMLLNLDLMRKKQSSKYLSKFLDKYHDKTKLHDQAAFNAVFKEWGELDYSWNYQVLMIQSRYKQLNITKREFQKLYDNPKIIHYNTGSKPWQYRNVHPYKYIFTKYYKELYGRISYSDISYRSVIKKTKEKLKYIYYYLLNLY